MTVMSINAASAAIHQAGKHELLPSLRDELDALRLETCHGTARWGVCAWDTKVPVYHI